MTEKWTGEGEEKLLEKEGGKVRWKGRDGGKEGSGRFRVQLSFSSLYSLGNQDVSHHRGKFLSYYWPNSSHQIS